MENMLGQALAFKGIDNVRISQVKQALSRFEGLKSSVKFTNN